jgi:hypothetical protein
MALKSYAGKIHMPKESGFDVEKRRQVNAAMKAAGNAIAQVWNSESLRSVMTPQEKAKIQRVLDELGAIGFAFIK